MDPEGTLWHGNMGSDEVQAKEIKEHGDQKWKSDQQVPATSPGRDDTNNWGKPNQVPREMVRCNSDWQLKSFQNREASRWMAE